MPQCTLLCDYCHVCYPFCLNDFLCHFLYYRSLALSSCFADFKTFALTSILLLKNNFTVHKILRAILHLENLCPTSLESSHDCVVVASYVTVMVFCFCDFLPVFGLGVMHLAGVVFVPILLGWGDSFRPEG